MRKHFLIAILLSLSVPAVGYAQTKTESIELTLFDAARYDLRDNAINIIQAGANVNAREYNGWTPLHWAVNQQNTDMIRLLLANGADVNAKTSGGNTPLHLAVCLSDLSSYIIDILLAKGADVNAENGNGWTPLHTATYHGDRYIVRTLLKNGADVNAKDNFRTTPLDMATSVELVKLLLDAGADLNLCCGSWLPLHRAAYTGEYLIVRLLLEKGADANAVDSSGMTPLAYAESKNNVRIIKLLKQYGAK